MNSVDEHSPSARRLWLIVAVSEEQALMPSHTTMMIIEMTSWIKSIASSSGNRFFFIIIRELESSIFHGTGFSSGMKTVK